MTRLSVNINKFATLRNARGGNNPDVLKAAQDCVTFGAHGITVHPRPDERHIRKSDVYEIADAIEVEFNIEGYPSEEFLSLVTEVRPAQCTLVPDPPEVLTSNAGWDAIRYQQFLSDVVLRLHDAGVRVSMFMETDTDQIKAAAKTGTDRIELYTGPYAFEFPNAPEKAVMPYRKAAEMALKEGLGVNAGHDLDLYNLEYFLINVPGVLEVSIGHALVCDALYMGLEETIRRYLACIPQAVV